MIQLFITFWRLKVLLISINTNGFVIGRLGTGPTLTWSLFALFYDRAGRTLNVQLCSRRTLTLGGSTRG